MKEERVRKLLKDSWKENSRNLVKQLGLKQVPTIEIDNTTGDFVMAVITNYTQQRVNILDKKILETSSDYIIHVNLEQLTETINGMMPVYLFDSDRCVKSTLKFLLAHECRHIWQAQSGYEVGSIIKGVDFNFNKGYGESKREKDANQFALKCVVDKRESILFNFLELNQRFTGKIFIYTEERAEMKSALSMLLKKYNPVSNIVNRLVAL